MGVVFFPSSPFMGVMLFPSLWLGNASGRWGVGGGGGGGWCILCAALLVFLPSSSPSSIPIFFSFLFFFLSGSTAFSYASSSFSLLCPHLFFLFSSFLSSFHYVFLLCPLLFFFEGIACTVCFEGIVCFLRCNRGHH